MMRRMRMRRWTLRMMMKMYKSMTGMMSIDVVNIFMIIVMTKMMMMV